jgi:hypothetical protein
VYVKGFPLTRGGRASLAMQLDGIYGAGWGGGGDT